MIEGDAAAKQLGFPLLVRPSYVLGGVAWRSSTAWINCMPIWPRRFDAAPGQPILIDKFLEDAYEFDVDALSDGKNCIIAGIMQHIEEAGVHSGDSTSSSPLT